MLRYLDQPCQDRVGIDFEHPGDGTKAPPFRQGAPGPHQPLGPHQLAMQRRAVRLEEIPLAYGAVPLPPGAATRMPVGTEVPPAYPAPIGAVGIGAEVERGVHLARPSPRGHDAGWWAPRRLGSVRVGLHTGGTGGLPGAARKGWGLTVVLWH